MKQVWVKAATCAWTAATTSGAAWPTLVTAMPEPRSMKEWPSTSTTTAPAARSTYTGRTLPTAEVTAAARRAASSRERGPGSSVTRRRSWATVWGPVSRSVIAVSSWGRPPPTGEVLAPRVRGVRLHRYRPDRHSRGVRVSRSSRGPPVPVTVATLLGSASLELTLHTRSAPVDRAVSWVHVSELADPTPFLAGGELLLTTGLALAPEGTGEYVRRLAAAGVVGLGLGTGLSHAEVPAELVTAADEHGLAVLEAPRSPPALRAPSSTGWPGTSAAGRCWSTPPGRRWRPRHRPPGDAPATSPRRSTGCGPPGPPPGR